ncbi:MAG TPA: hypothetical protein VD815_09070 [Candidatus Saccharimonadales bacterium]|nr:hypothetical protein [Candidatus Saccharimonadales bacterium]
MTNLLPKDDANSSSNDIENNNQIDLFLPISNSKKTNRDFTKKDIQTVKKRVVMQLTAIGMDTILVIDIHILFLLPL